MNCRFLLQKIVLQISSINMIGELVKRRCQIYLNLNLVDLISIFKKFLDDKFEREGLRSIFRLKVIEMRVSQDDERIFGRYMIFFSLFLFVFIR